jgi:hypothetical protein
MIVKDLISQLKKLPQDAIVVSFKEDGRIEFVSGIAFLKAQNQIEITFDWTTEGREHV